MLKRLVVQKPIHRSKLRIIAGRIYYTLKRYWYWNFSNVLFAKKRDALLPVEIFTHKTVLRRKLKDVDMWMQENKIINLGIAIRTLDGIVLASGETFSYWRYIGKPTTKKGYVEGMVLHNGHVMTGVGGGLCQLSNLIYWMTLHTPLTVIERWRHGYDVFPDVGRDQPFGSGATCAYPNIDLQIKNNTTQSFQLSLTMDDDYLIGKWLSDKPIEFRYTIVEKDHEFKGEWFGGYSRNNKIFRTVIDRCTNEKVREEFVAENHALTMYTPLIEGVEEDRNRK